MVKPMTIIALAAMALAGSGCAMLEPPLPQAAPSVPSTWPESPANAQQDIAGAPQAAHDIGWRNFFTDPKLVTILAGALENNRDLRIAALNIERTRAQYQIQQAQRWPALGISASGQRSGGSAAPENRSVYQVGAGISAFELDLFGRLHNLSAAAFQQLLAQEQARRAVQLSLVAEIANTYILLAADLESQRVAQGTLEAQQSSYDLVLKRYELGAVSALDVSQARTTVETARADVARFAGLVAQDTHALDLLAGAPVQRTLLPQDFDIAVSGLGPLPAGLPSDVLLRRPDILQAEHLLRSTNANIGAARAAFFPSLSLTGSIGSASPELSGLFESGTRTWSFIPQLNLPIFQGGRLRAGLAAATTDRDIALAQYEQAIQGGFREVADALVLTRTLAERRQAQEALLEAAQQAFALSQARYDRGRDSYLNVLDAQRSLYTAQQGAIAAQLAEQGNRLTLYRVLGGGWEERSAPAM